MPKAAVSDRSARPESTNQIGPRSQKGVRTRARLIDAARVVFERDGFLTARIADIATGGRAVPGRLLPLLRIEGADLP